MGIKETGFLFMFFHFCIITLSSTPLHQETSPSDFMHDKNLRGESTHEQTSNVINGSDTSIEHTRKFQHEVERRAAGGGGSRPTNPGESGSNGGTKSPATQGGANFIPVYAAGAASNRHPNHRGAANCNRIEASTLIAATMASVLHLYTVFKHG